MPDWDNSFRAPGSGGDQNPAPDPLRRRKKCSGRNEHLCGSAADLPNSPPRSKLIKEKAKTAPGCYCVFSWLLLGLYLPFTWLLKEMIALDFPNNSNDRPCTDPLLYDRTPFGENMCSWGEHLFLVPFRFGSIFFNFF